MEQPRTYYDTKFKTSAEFQKPGSKSVYIPVWREVLNVIQVNKIKKVLDLGCGPGQFAQYAFSIIPDLDYTGIDFSPEAIKMAKAKNTIGKFSCADIFKVANTEHTKYDAVLLLEVLEHLNNDLQLLSSIQNKLLICTVPNFPSVSHVRHFKTIADVRDRYAQVINITHTAQVSIKKNTFFLFCGTVNQ